MKRHHAVSALVLLLALALALAFACTIGGGEDKSGGNGQSHGADDDQGDDADDDDAGDDDLGDDAGDDDLGDDAGDDSAGCDVPTPEFDATPRQGQPPLSVHFTDLSQTDPDCPLTAWAWDFGDGANSHEQSPTHAYQAAGSYNVTLYVYNAAGSSMLTKHAFIVVSCGVPTAAFTGAPTAGDVPLSVQFTNQSAPACPNPAYHWDFGDDGTSAEANPTHVYLRAGTYTVALTVTTAGGQNTATKRDYIHVACGGPVADFVGDPTEGRAPLQVQFHQLGSGYCPNTQLVWYFGDNQVGYGTDPTHAYQMPGTYDVWLGVYHNGQFDQALKQGYIAVTRNAVELHK